LFNPIALGFHHLGYFRLLTKLQELLASLRDHLVNVVEDSVTAESLHSRREREREITAVRAQDAKSFKTGG